MSSVYFAFDFSARLRRMDIRLIKIGEKEEWDKMVEAHPHGGVEQSWGWGELQTRIPGRPAFFVLGVFEEGADGDASASPSGGAMLVRQVMGFGKTWLWCPRGPLLPAEGARAAWDGLLAAVKVLAKEGGDVFLRIEPSVPIEEDFVVEGETAKEHYLPTDTLVLDLSLSEGEILGQMSQNGRANIKRAEKSGVLIKKAGVESLPLFYALLADTADRDAFSVHGEGFYKDFLRQAHFYLAFLNDVAVAGILVTYFGRIATYYFGASSSAHRESRASYLLQWTAIQEAKKTGMQTYDFLGIAPEGTAGHPLEGVTHFKTRFGGKRISYHPAQVFVFRPVWWRLYRLAKLFF